MLLSVPGMELFLFWLEITQMLSALCLDHPYHQLPPNADVHRSHRHCHITNLVWHKPSMQHHFLCKYPWRQSPPSAWISSTDCIGLGCSSWMWVAQMVCVASQMVLIQAFKTIRFQQFKLCKISVLLSTALSQLYPSSWDMITWLLAMEAAILDFAIFGGSHLDSMGSHLIKCSPLQTTKSST